MGGDTSDITSLSGSVNAQNLLLQYTKGSTLSLGTNNIFSADPLFRDPANGDFGLQVTSPALSNADPVYLPLDTLDADMDGDTTDPIDFDINGAPRGLGGTSYDLGAVELELGDLTVTNNNDSGQGSLRQAIENANANPNFKFIRFAIPGDGPHEILLESNLPNIVNDGIVIDGTSQAGYVFEQPAVTVNFDSTFGALIVDGNNCSVLGLRLINGGDSRLFYSENTENLTLSQNVFSTNLGQDHMFLVNVNNSTIHNNLIGIDTNGVENTSANHGIALNGCSNNNITFNTIAGGAGGILLLMGSNANNNNISNNFLGISKDNQYIGGAIGIQLTSCSGNTVEDNSIADSGQGILISDDFDSGLSQNNLFRENSFLCNRQIGIRINFGNQNNIAPPSITSAIPGTISGTSDPDATVEIFFQIDGCPEGENACQGLYLGTTTADQSGNWTFQDEGLILDRVVTATQTAGSNSSAFGDCVTIMAMLDCDIVAETTADTITCLNPIANLSATSNKENATYSWSGPNGFSATAQDTSTSTAGLYTLIATEGECSDTSTIEVIEDPTTLPQADFQAVSNDLEFSFSNLSTGDANTYAWDFGDGNTSTDTDPMHTYQSNGTYTVQLIASNSCGSDTSTQQIVIAANLDTIKIIIPERIEGAVGDTVDIPITASNFNEVIAFQFSLFQSDPNVASFVGFREGSLPNLDMNSINIFNDSTLSFVWFGDGAITTSETEPLLYIRMLINSNEDLCTNLSFIDTPTKVEIGVVVGNGFDIEIAPVMTSTGEVCVLPFANITGNIFREDSRPIDEVTVVCTNQTPFSTAADGYYEFLDLNAGLDYRVTPQRFTDHKEGLSAIDLALILRHILGIQALPSPYKIIAADVNLSEAITAIDLALIQQIILGIQTDFPDVASAWRFVEAGYDFSNPANPLAEAFPESVLVEQIRRDTVIDFVGLKLGDVNDSSLGANEEEELPIVMLEKEEGNKYVIDFVLGATQNMVAYQFDVNYNPQQMKLMNILPGKIPGLAKNNFGLKMLDQGIIPTLWYDPTGNPEGRKFEEGEVLFSLEFKRSAVAAPVEELIWAGDRTIAAAGFGSNGKTYEVTSKYKRTAADTQMELLAIQPNPFSAETNIQFSLAQREQLNLSIFDAMGKKLKETNGTYEAGQHQVRLKASELGAPGWYLVKLQSGSFVETRKIILQQ